MILKNSQTLNMKRSYNDETWHSLPYLKKFQKIYKSHELKYPLNSAEISIFSQGLHFNTKFLIFNFFVSLKVVLINIVAILMMLEKLAILDLTIKVF